MRRFRFFLLGGGAVAAVATALVAVSGGDRGRIVVLPAGTTIALSAVDTITSRSDRVGEPVAARVLADVRSVDSSVVIPAGATFHGTVTAIAPAERPGQRGTLRVAFASVRFRGESYPIRAQVLSLATVMRGRGVTAGDAAKVGAGTVGGAVAGRVIGRNRRGTLIGAAVGTAAGVAVAASSRDVDIVLPQGAAVRVRLTAPFEPRQAPRTAS